MTTSLATGSEERRRAWPTNSGADRRGSELATRQATAVRRTGSSSGNVLCRSTSSTTVSCRMVSACSVWGGGDQDVPSPDRSHTRRSPIPALIVPLSHPLQLLHSLKTGSAVTLQNAAKSRSTPSCATGSSTCSATGRQNGNGACRSALVRWSACVPARSTGSTRTLRTAVETERAKSSTARQEDPAGTRRHDTAERAHLASDRRLVP